MAYKGAPPDESDPEIKALLDDLAEAVAVKARLEEEYQRMRSGARAAILIAVEACRARDITWPQIARIHGGSPQNLATRYSAALADLAIARADRARERDRAGAAGRGSGRRGARPARGSS